MTPFDRFRAIPGSIDISIAQRIRLRRQTLILCENMRSPEISASSIATRQLRQGWHLTEMAGKLIKIARTAAADRSPSVSLCSVRVLLNFGAVFGGGALKKRHGLNESPKIIRRPVDFPCLIRHNLPRCHPRSWVATPRTAVQLFVSKKALFAVLGPLKRAPHQSSQALEIVSGRISIHTNQPRVLGVPWELMVTVGRPPILILLAYYLNSRECMYYY